MAEISLWKFVFKNSVNAPFVADDVVIVYYDDVALNFVTKLNGTQIYSGPSLGEPKSRDRRSPIINYTIFQEPADQPTRRYCEVTDLISFPYILTFPYAFKAIDYDSPLCYVTGIVCDISFTGVAVIVKPTTPTATDGQITVTATTSNGTVKYSLQDEDYSDMTNTTGVLTGLGVGTYNVYAKDNYGCSDTLIVTLSYDVSYGPLYRIEYDKYNGDVGVIDIEERDYAGAVTEVKGSDTPFVVRLRGEDSELFNSVLSTECSIGLTSETNFQFLDLFTQDDRKYRVIAKTNVTEYWRGFIKPGLYQEQYYTKTNYYVSAEATDQLVTLQDLLFVDKDGNKIKGINSLIKIISFILAKTDLNLPIRSCVNIWEVDMDQTASDDPLEQTHIDTDSFYGEDGEPFVMLDVLRSILQSFGSRLFQWQGYWYIVPLDFYTATIEYRDFDVNGDYVTNGTFDPLVNIDLGTQTVRASWTGRSQNLEVRKAFGKCDVIHKLIKPKQFVENGGFEKYKVDSKPRTGSINDWLNHIGTFDAWSLVLNGNLGNYVFTIPSRDYDDEPYPIARRQNEGYACTIYSDSSNTTEKSDVYIVSKEADIVYTKSDAINFKFEFNASRTNYRGYINPPIVKFKWSVKLGTYYLQGDGSWTTDTDFEWVEVIVEEGNFNTWNTIDITANCPDISGELLTTYQIRLMHGKTPYGRTWYYTSNADLKATLTADLPLNYINFINDGSNLKWYKLTAGTKATSGDDILRPDDYAVTTNEVYWTLFQKKTYYVPNTSLASFNTVTVASFDNVYFELLPQKVQSPDEYKSTTENDANIKDNNEVTVFTGDAPGITNSTYLYKNWYRYADGTQTRYWNREGVSESDSILQLLSKRIIELHNLPKFKLTGTLTTDFFYGFRNSLYEVSTGKYFVPMSMSINDLRCEYDVELQEVGELTSTGIDGIGQFDGLAFTNAFNI